MSVVPGHFVSDDSDGWQDAYAEQPIAASRPPSTDLRAVEQRAALRAKDCLVKRPRHDFRRWRCLLDRLRSEGALP